MIFYFFYFNKRATAHAKDGEKDRDDNLVTQQGAVWMLEAHGLMILMFAV